MNNFTGHGNAKTDSRELLVVRHISRRGAELGVGLDDFVHSLQEVLLRGNLAAGTNGEHACFRAN